MLLIERDISSILKSDLEQFPIIMLTGPRQSGKSTLLKNLFSDWKYVNLEEPSMYDFAREDPKGLIASFNSKVIFDEIQRVPTLLSQIQVEVDKDRTLGRFAITGSHNLLLLEKVSQSLAGRTAVRNLLPFSYQELAAGKINLPMLEDSLFYGGYPLVYEQLGSSSMWLNSYISTYIERDVRMIRAVSDLGTFRNFIKVCAGRAGQLLDLSGIGNDIGVSHNTVRDWINVLEASFVAFRLQPYFKNFSKRIIKSPKLYFYDTGLLCRLLDIRSSTELMTHSSRGAIFENWCVVETIKTFLNRGENPPVYFWNDQSIEVDLLIQKNASNLLACECKSSKTPLSDFLKSPMKLKSYSSDMEITPCAIFGGDESQIRSTGTIHSWREFVSEVL